MSRAWASVPSRVEDRDHEVETEATIAAMNPVMSAVMPAATSTSTRVKPPRHLLTVHGVGYRLVVDG